jgi:hypothetical protein
MQLAISIDCQFIKFMLAVAVIVEDMRLESYPRLRSFGIIETVMMLE